MTLETLAGEFEPSALSGEEAVRRHYQLTLEALQGLGREAQQAG